MLGRRFWQVKPAISMVYTRRQGNKFIVWQSDSWSLLFYGLRAVFQRLESPGKAKRSVSPHYVSLSPNSRMLPRLFGACYQ
jgi:hypothetical protein